MTTQLITALAANHFRRDLSNKVLKAAIASLFTGVVLMLVQPEGELTPRHQGWLGPVTGAVADALAGICSLTGQLIITYLMALRPKRDEFVSSISIIYLLGAIPMYGAMYAAGGWHARGWMSAIELVPMYLGIGIGASIRGQFSEAVFRRVLLAFLILLSVGLLLK